MNIDSQVMYAEENNGITVLRFNALKKYSHINHAVSTRMGGVSTIHGLESLNLGTHTADDMENVKENYRRFCNAAGFDASSVVLGKQTHSANVRVASYADKGKGVFAERDYTDVDALVTNCKKLPIVIHTADCVPVGLFDIKGRAVGNAHCGWRGTFSELAANTADVLYSEYGVTPEELVCTVGPCICQRCYEVSEELYLQFEEKFGKSEALVKEGTSFYIDLAGINCQILISKGVKEDNIIVSDLCTCCRTDIFFSHRGQGPERGILASVAELV